MRKRNTGKKKPAKKYDRNIDTCRSRDIQIYHYPCYCYSWRVVLHHYQNNNTKEKVCYIIVLSLHVLQNIIGNTEYIIKYNERQKKKV